MGKSSRLPEDSTSATRERQSATDGTPSESPSQRPAPQKRTGAWALFVATAAAISILAGGARGGLFAVPDTRMYLKIAQGETASVLQPFALRQLGPLVCRALMSIFHFNVYSAFVVEGVVSLLVLLGIVGFLLLRANADAILLAAVGGLAFWSILFSGIALPDLWFAALLGVFLLLLDRKHFLASALMLFPLFFSRESSILVLFCLLVAGWRRLSRVDYAVAVIASIAGMGTVKYLTSGGLSNVEHLGTLLYLAGKVFSNFSANVLGIPLWNDRFPVSCGVVQWQMSLHIGAMHMIGGCGYDPARTLRTLVSGLSSFGLLPILFLYLWRKRPHSIWRESVMLHFCFLYGAISFLLAPVLGVSVGRLFGYAWPLFVVAVPILALKNLSVSFRPAVALLCLHLAAAWCSSLFYYNISFAAEFVQLLALAVIYAGGWALLRQSKFAFNETQLPV